MSLRDQLRNAVACSAPLAMQHATFDAGDATPDATSVQQNPATPHEYWLSGATDHATTVQLGAKSDATEGGKLRVAFATACNTQLSLTALRQVRELIDAAMLACDAYGDNQAAREQMRRDIEATPQHLRADLLDHLNQTYRPGENQ